MEVPVVVVVFARKAQSFASFPLHLCRQSAGVSISLWAVWILRKLAALISFWNLHWVLTFQAGAAALNLMD